MTLFRRFHYLSGDIVLGALATSCLASRTFMARPGWAWWLALGLTVWVLYTGDHLLDAFRYRKKGLKELHSFIWGNRRLLLWAMGVILVVDLMLIFNFLKESLLPYSLGLAGLVLLFYAIRHLLRKNRILFIPGEIFVLLLYMAGTWLGPFVTRGEELLPVHGLVALMMAGVLLMNLGIISYYDIRLDSRLGIASLAHSLGRNPTRNLVLLTGILVWLMALLQFMVFGADRFSGIALILAGMASILLLVLYLPSWSGRDEYHRMASDAVLIMGFLALIVGA